MQSLPDALLPLAAYRQFILWMLAERGGKIVKLPVDYRTASVGDAHDPNIWMDAATAIVTAKLYGEPYGVGFVFTKDDPFFFADIDKCLQPDNTWSPIANDLMNRLSGAAVEISQSGSGLHIIGQGITPEHACKNTPLGLEFYTKNRFVALTGTNIIGSAATDCSAMLPALVNDYFPPKTSTKDQSWTTKPLPEWNGSKQDKKLIEKACGAKSASSVFGGRASFESLWGGDENALAEAYGVDDRPYDSSSADAALAQHLAFWTGNDCERILRLMWKSGLVREKWDRPDYLIRTITRAVSMQTVVYTGGKKKEPERIPVETAAQPMGNLTGPEIMAGYQFLDASRQIEHFKGCVYVQEIHRVFTPSGSLLKSEQFNATYGGYVFQLDGDLSGKTTRKAWEAFTESQAVRYPKAETMCFYPELTPGELIRREGRILVNTYIPINTLRMEGDVSPFLEHLAKVLPVETDRGILLAYMAAVIQHKGVKFQWAPVLQGIDGNGKTLFTRCVAFAVGEKYTHLPRASDIDNKFNWWMINKIFIGVEDLYVPDHRNEVIEALKPMITNDSLEVQGKGMDQITTHVCANFILNANRKDGIRKGRNDRRYAVFFTAQQTKEDIERDGMGGNYFPNLYKWLKKENGYAIVAQYLENYSIPDALNPATACHRAPVTSSTDEVITASLGGIEQEVIEAIDEGRPGFNGGWISSMAFERLLHSLNAIRAIPHNKRRELLQSLGYDWHPALKDGRVNIVIPFDGGKPRLFIKLDHIHANLKTATEIVRAYQESQGVLASPNDAEAVFR